MIRWRPGHVKRVVRDEEGFQELLVEVDGTLEKAVNYTSILGRAGPGDQVVLNTSAVTLGLGTGGYHFVAWNEDRWPPEKLDGHIMKMRYTPFQLVCPVAEAPESRFHEALKAVGHLAGMPVVAASLHSQVGPVAAGVKALAGGLRVAYVMTDGGALPLAFSENVRALRREGLIDVTVTAGHAFGGDIEAVNVYSGLLAAKWAGMADIAVVSLGPGVVGTGTSLGTTALDQGQALNAAISLKGIPIAVPRIGYGDDRERHRGISHHTLTVLNRVCLGRCLVVLPREARATDIPRSLQKSQVAARHRVVLGDGAPAMDLLGQRGFSSLSMGRQYCDDPLFFLAAGAAGRWACRLARKERSNFVL